MRCCSARSLTVSQPRPHRRASGRREAACGHWARNRDVPTLRHQALMATAGATAPLVQRAIRLEYFTITWNVIEAVASIGAGIAAGSIALVGFGFDSSIEGFAASVVLWQLRRGENEERKKRALRLIASTFFVLAAYVILSRHGTWSLAPSRKARWSASSLRLCRLTQRGGPGLAQTDRGSSRPPAVMALDMQDLAPAHRDHLVESFGLVIARPSDIQCHNCPVTRGHELSEMPFHTQLHMLPEDRTGLLSVVSGWSAGPWEPLDSAPLHFRMHQVDQLLKILALVGRTQCC
jgi:hypothetical protein